jgi:hypothetical protein
MTRIVLGRTLVTSGCRCCSRRSVRQCAIEAVTGWISLTGAHPSAGSPRDIFARGALPARHEVECLSPLLRGRHPGMDVCGQWGKRRTARSCALAKHMRLAEGHRARQRDSRDRLIGLRLAANTVRAIPTPSPGQRQGGSISAIPAKRPLGCSERCIRNLAARQR